MIEPLHAFARRFCREPYDAEDLVQETLLKAWSNLDSFTPGTRMKSWLFTIMRNTFYNRIRVYDRERPAPAGCASEAGSLAASQDLAVECAELVAAIRVLPPDQKQVMILVSILGISYRDASEICDCRIGTIQSRLFRARTRLADATPRNARCPSAAPPAEGGGAASGQTTGRLEAATARKELCAAGAMRSACPG